MMIDSDKKRREFILKTDELRKKKNQIALEISQKKKAGEDASLILAEMQGSTWTPAERTAKRYATGRIAAFLKSCTAP